MRPILFLDHSHSSLAFLKATLLTFMLCLLHACVPNGAPTENANNANGVSGDQLLQHAASFRYSSPDSLRYLTDKIQRTAIDQNDTSLYIRAVDLFGNVLVHTQDSSLVPYAEKLMAKLGPMEPLNRAMGRYFLAQHFILKERYKEAEVLLNEMGTDPTVLSNIELSALNRIARIKSAAQQRNCGVADSLAALNLQLLAGTDHSELASHTLLHQAKCYVNIGDPEAARVLYSKGLKELGQIKNPDLAGQLELGIGFTHSSQGRVEPAANALFRALNDFKAAGCSRHEASTLSAMAYNYWTVLEAPVVLEYWQQALVIADSLSFSRHIALINGELARFFVGGSDEELTQMGIIPAVRIDTAYKLIHYAQSVALSIPDQNLYMNFLRSEASILNREENYVGSLEILDQVLQFYLNVGDNSKVIATLNSIASNQLGLERLGLALQNLEQALQMANAGGFVNSKKHSLYRLAHVHKRLGQYKEAVQYMEAHTQLKDSLQGIDVVDKLAQQELRYVFSEEQRTDSLQHLQAMQIQQLSAKAELDEQRSRTQLIVLCALLVLLAVGAVFLLDRRKRKSKYDLSVAQLETKVLRAQLDPHVIGNSLHAINTYLLSNDADSASTLLSRFSKWMRTMLEASRHETIPLEHELAAMRAFMNLEQKRTFDRFEFNVTVAPDIDQQHTMIPPLLIQPFLENAIKHGILPNDGPGHILLNIVKHGPMLQIAIEDDGVGIDTSSENKKDDQHSAKKNRSLSTIITKERLALLNEKGRAATMHFDDIAQGTRLVIQIPLVSEI